MLKKLFRYFLVIFIVLFILISGIFTYFWYQLEQALHNTPILNQASISQFYEGYKTNNSAPLITNSDGFTYSDFKNPTIKYAPWTRWWLPGNLLDKKVLSKEIIKFKENFFGGVEIQSFTTGLDKKSDNVNTNKIFGFDSESYYQNIIHVLEEAKNAGIGVDLTVGSGWPSGGKQITIQDNLKTLIYGDLSLSGSKAIEIELPKPKRPFSYNLGAFAELLAGIQILDFRPELAKLVTVLAAKEVKNNRSWNFLNLDEQIQLDPNSVQVLDSNIKNNKLYWAVPEGNWRLIAIYQMPSGENPILVAQKPSGYVLDHLDSTKVIGNLNYLFGKRTGLKAYHGSHIRAVFNDSFEFAVERHFSDHFLSYFQKTRGYDLKPHLPSIFMPAYDNFYVEAIGLKRKPDFIIDENDERIRHDYSQAVSDEFISQFLEPTEKWAKSNSLLSRVQAYGMEIDVIKASGNADIPETEQLYAGGSNLFLKIASSGAHLYNKPLISAETGVFMNRDYMTTPEKLKVAVDKLFVAGINQIIFHGTPYPISSPIYGEMGWFPFSSPFSSLSFSSNISDKSPFWDFQKILNTYIARCQYVLRQGKPKVDFLIYYPYLGFSGSFDKANHQELLFNGIMPEIEYKPKRKINPLPSPFNRLIKFQENSRNQWLTDTWQIIQMLESYGYTWDWVNDESLMFAEIDKENNISIRGNSYKAVLLPNVKSIQLEAAQKLLYLSKKGSSIVLYGNTPKKQHGFYQYQKNDQIIKEAFEELLTQNRVKTANNMSRLLLKAQDSSFIRPTIQFSQKNDFLKYACRELESGEKLIFLQNTDTKIQYAKIKASGKYKKYFWLDPLTGAIYETKTDKENSLELTLEKYETIILLCGEPKDFLTKEEKSYLSVWKPHQNKIQKIDLGDWLLTVQGSELENGAVNLGKVKELFDWRTKSEIKYVSSLGIYVTEFQLDNFQSDLKYILDLGSVYYTATVMINNKEVGKLWLSPYRLDISNYLLKGRNRITVSVHASPLNKYIGFARRNNWNDWITGKMHASDRFYKQFQGREYQLMPAGMLGNVQIRIYK